MPFTKLLKDFYKKSNFSEKIPSETPQSITHATTIKCFEFFTKFEVGLNWLINSKPKTWSVSKM